MSKEKIINDIENKYQQLEDNSETYLKKSETNSMHLLEPKRMIDDEGFFRFLKILMQS